MSHATRRRRVPLVCATALLLAAVPAAGAQAAPRTLTSVTGALTAAKPLDVCGVQRAVRTADVGAAVAARARRGSKAFRGMLVLERCENGAWKLVRRLGRSSASFTAPTDGDYRVRIVGAKGSGISYLRSGVGEIIDVPFTDKVKLTNRTLTFCAPIDTGAGTPPDKAWPVRGHLTGPRAAIEGKDPAVTIYYHGLSYGEFFWRFRDVPGYDTSTELAKKGHVSLTVDRLGYGASSGISGNGVCYGIQADIAQQLSRSLRVGSYEIGTGRDPISFSRVGLVGHSAGAFIAELAEYSFPNAFDALGMLGYGDQTTSATTATTLGVSSLECLAGGSPQDADGPGRYAFFGATEADFRAAHLNAPTDPAVADAVAAKRAKDPCGDLLSIGPALLTNQLGASLVSGPVLLLAGADDVLFPPPVVELQQARMVNAKVTTKVLPGTGHGLTFGRTAPEVREILSGFLSENGL